MNSVMFPYKTSLMPFLDCSVMYLPVLHQFHYFLLAYANVLIFQNVGKKHWPVDLMHF